MLDLMRKHAKSWFINLFVAAIAIVFIFWGVGSFREKSGHVAATVNADAISMGEFQDTYRRMVDSARNQYRDLLTDELIKALNLKGQALERLIDERLLLQKAKSLGLDVTDDDLRQEIAQTPYFQVNGRFNQDMYRRFLQASRLTPTQFEQLFRRDLLGRKVVAIVSGQAKVSLAEAQDFYRLIKDRLDLDFVLFAKDKYLSQVVLLPDQVLAFFEKNKERYRVPAKMKVIYLDFRPNDFKGEVEVTDDEVAEYYELNQDKYKQPEQVKARHILFKIDPAASDEEKAKVRAKAEEVLQKAKGETPEDFGQLAEKNSEDPGSAPKGGDLGWFSRGQMVKSFSDTAFSMEKGQISGLVESQYGLHIIKVEDRRPAGSQALDEVKNEIRDKMIKDKATRLAVDKAEEAADQASLLSDFDAVAKKTGLTPKTTDFFTADQAIPEVGGDRRFNQLALSLRPGEMGPLLETKEGHYLIKALEKHESFLPKLDEVKEKVEEDLRQDQALDMALKEAENYIAKNQKGEKWEELAKEQGLETESTGPFTRQGPVPKIAGDRKTAIDAFALENPGQIAQKPLKGEKGYYVIRLKEKMPAKDEDFLKEQDKFLDSMAATKKQAYLQQWLETVRTNSKIKIEDGVI